MKAKIELVAGQAQADPHICMAALDGKVHVLPVEMVERFIRAEPVEMDVILLRTITKEWLENLIGEPIGNKSM